MEAGKIKNYLLYAVGEIVLVVIGILIALQIGTWNDERRDRKLEQVYYCKLLEDVNQDRFVLERLIFENSDRIKAGNVMIQMLQQKSPNRKELIRQMRANVSKITFTFKPSLAAFDDLKSSGHLNLLKDNIIKKQLINYYSALEGYTNVLDSNTTTALAVYTNPFKDFAEVGFQDIEGVRRVLDTTLVDTKKLAPVNYPSEKVRKLLLSEAIYYLNVNSRNAEIRQLMLQDIGQMQRLLEAKCTAKK
jgi:hypothetical protein